MNVAWRRRVRPVIIRTDAVVIGSGVAGLTAALRLAPRDVTLLTKAAELESGSTAWAQGGIAVALADEDSPADHAADTLAAGDGLNDAANVDILTRDGVARIRELLDEGLPFDADETGVPQLGREAAHGRRRILHAGGDATGRHLQRSLIEAVKRTGSITVAASCFAWDLIVTNGNVRGVLAHDAARGWVVYQAPAVILASGGSGQLYAHTTNPAEGTADGLAMAARAGARLADLEFVQFHPTALRDPAAVTGRPMPLLTEALRGEGAVLLGGDGERFMPAEHPDAELAPRDVVARAVWRRVAAGEDVRLDMRAVMRGPNADHFPTVRAYCAAAGFDPCREPIPVAPAAHYHMGGVATDASGRTSLPGLWACGEAAANGVHGANRLASNSLLEGLVFASRVAEDVADEEPADVQPLPPIDPPLIPDLVAKEDVTAITARLRHLMYEHAGLVRDAASLDQALTALAAIAVRAAALPMGKGESDGGVLRRWGELRNLSLAGRLVVMAAQRRCESRGAHYRADFPKAVAQFGKRSFLTCADLPASCRTGMDKGIAVIAAESDSEDDERNSAPLSA